jgi:hypothetical protein
MLNHIKKTIQISGISAVLFSTALLNISPAKAVDVSQMFGADLTWQCGLAPTIQPRIRLNQNDGGNQDSVRFNILPCEPPKPEKPPEPPLTQLIQQGVQMIQTAQPLIQQLIQPLTSIAAPPAPQQR